MTHGAVSLFSSFESWVDYVFNHPVTNPQWHFDSRLHVKEPPPEMIVPYLTSLFQNPEESLSSFTKDQVAQGLNYLVSPSCSNYMFALRDDSIPWEKRELCIAAIYNLYERYFSKHCAETLSHLGEEGNPLNGPCYMWWDVFPWFGHPKESQYAKLDDAILSVMEKTLLINHVACQEGALHGLGHWARDYPQRVAQTIDGFLNSSTKKTIPFKLAQYAALARWGYIL